MSFHIKICSLILVILLESNLLYAEGAEPAPANDTDTNVAIEYRPIENLKSAASWLISKDSGSYWFSAVAATLIANHFDPQAEQFYRNQDRHKNLDRLGNEILGTGVPGALIGLGQWYYGSTRTKNLHIQAGQSHLETLVVTGLVTGALKLAFNRQRPDASNRHSFPSGHTSTVFATAASLHEFYGLKVGLPAYLLAAATAAGRISVGQHYLSDTVGGAALGIIFAHAFALRHKAFLSTSDLSVLPWSKDDALGLFVQKNF